MNKLILWICYVSILFSGCSRITTDPTLLFIEVQSEVSQRSGHCIAWQKLEFKNWLEDALLQELTIDQVIQIALLNNQNLRATYDNLGIAQAEVAQSAFWNNPIFSLSLRYENLIDGANIIEMGLVQNLLDILLKPLKKRLAYSKLERVKSDVAAQMLDIIGKTKIAYHSLQAAEEILEMQKQILETLEAAHDVAERLYKAGNIPHLALAIERSKYENMKIDVAQSEVVVIEAREKLNVLMGLWGLCIHWKLAKTTCEIPNNSEYDWVCIENRAISNSLDLLMARQQLISTALRFGIERSKIVFPRITVGPDSEKESDGTWFIGPQFSFGVPMFDYGSAMKAKCSAELSKQWNAYTALAIEIRSTVRSAHFRMSNALRQYRCFQDTLIPISEEITQETLKQLNAMQLGVFELLSVKQNEIETKLKSMLSYREYWTARTELEALLSGRLLK